MRNAHATSHGSEQQLSLLPPLPDSARPVRFRLSRETRERGLRHAAEIKRMIAAREATRRAESSHRLRRPAA